MEIAKIIIGLETHIELKTLAKMFCGCPSQHFGKEPNSQVCPVCLGLPGALPVPNKKAIEWTILLGLSLKGEVLPVSFFDRKNYFYPDLPKGYQISQYEYPFVRNGYLLLDSGKKLRIRRVHLEEDTGKLIHQSVEGEKVTLIDFNRSGVPLVEIVSEPDLSSSLEAKEYLEKLQQIVRYLGVSDADMEKGSMRCEPNVNLKIKDGENFYYTPIVELKNINSFRFVKKAIDFEAERQFEVFGQTKIQKSPGNKETRGWDEGKKVSFPQRAKEEASDYRYFPEPDIPPIRWTEKEISNIELPTEKKKRFIKNYGLSEYQAKLLTAERKTADYFENAWRIAEKEGISVQELVNVIINKRAKEGLSETELVEFILSSKQKAMISEKELDKMIEKLLASRPEIVEGYKKSGKDQSLGVIVGLIKKETGIIVPIERIKDKINE